MKEIQKTNKAVYFSGLMSASWQVTVVVHRQMIPLPQETR